MSRRLLPAVLLLVTIACAAVVVLVVRDERAAGPPAAATATSAAARALLASGAGPSGSGVVALRRWRYRGDPGDRGRRLGWQRGDFGGRSVRVPYSPNATAHAGARGERAYAGSVGWFARTIEVPVTARYALTFESAHHGATVYVDGRPRRAHVGAYQPFSARLRLTAGRHRVAVRVDWRDPRRQALSGWARAWFNYGGLQRPVTLARLGPVELGALSVRTRLTGARRAQVRIGVRVRNRAARRTVALRGTLARGGRVVARLRFASATIGTRRSRTLTAVVAVDDPALWSPARPDLHELRVEVPGQALLRRRIGLREIGWGADGLSLNGAPLTLRGISLPADARGRGDALRPIDERRIIAAIRATGANATRSQMPLSHSLLERLDAAGILVWQQIGPFEPGGAWRARAPQQIAAARDRALRTAEAQQAHPSILAWTLTNEVANQGQPAQQQYIVQAARALRERDPTRPVALDVWGSMLPRSGGRIYDAVDALGVTDYVGWYEGLALDDAGQEAVTRARLAGLRALFAGKPLVVTEVGGAGSARVTPGAFGSLRFQADLLARRVRALRDDPSISGTIVWTLRDYALRPDFRGGSVLRRRPDLTLAPGLNEKGVFDFAGRPKPALAALRRAFARPG